MVWLLKKGCGTEFYNNHKNEVLIASQSTSSLMWLLFAHFDPAE